MRALAERVFALVAQKRDADALALFKTYPNVGGPLAKWLRAYAASTHGKHRRGQGDGRGPRIRRRTRRRCPRRMIAALTYGAMKDSRHGDDYVKPIVQAGFVNPDVAFAAEKVGVGKVATQR